MSLSGNSLRSEKIQNSKLLLNETFGSDPSFAPGIYFWEPGSELYHDNSFKEKESIKVRFYSRNYSAANGTTVKFQTLIDTPVYVGDVIYDSNTNEYYLCTESFNIDEIHWKGKLTLCTWVLRWQNRNGDILEYPCYTINATQYNSGETANRVMTIGSSQHLILLPYDENTVIIESPQRFFLDKNKVSPTSFIVTQNDTVSFNHGDKGIVRITVLQCATNNTADRIDLGICDYIEKQNIKKDNSNNDFASRSVIFYDTTVIKSGGDYQEFVGKFYSKDGVEVRNIIPKWDIVCDFIDSLIIEKYDDKIKIGIDNDKYVDEEFKLILSDDNNQYSSSVLLKVESLL